MTKFKNSFRTAALVFATLAVVMTVGAVAEAQTRGLHGAHMKVEISTKCEGDRAVFTIHNAGTRWQETGEIIIISEIEKKIIVRRKIVRKRASCALPDSARSETWCHERTKRHPNFRDVRGVVDNVRCQSPARMRLNRRRSLRAMVRNPGVYTI